MLEVNGEYVSRQVARGLMWLTLARDGASPGETWIASHLHSRLLGHVRHQGLAGLDTRNFTAPIRQLFAGIAAPATGAPSARVLTQPGS